MGLNDKGVLLITVEFQAAEAGHRLTEIMNACRNAETCRTQPWQRHHGNKQREGRREGESERDSPGGGGNFDLNIKCMKKETPSSSSHQKKP